MVFLNCSEPAWNRGPGYPAPNFNTSDTFLPISASVGSVLLLFLFIGVGIRLYHCLGNKHRILAEDWICFASFITCVPYTIISITQSIRFGHAWDVSICASLTVPFRQKLIAEQYLLLAARTLSKTAVAFFYLRVFNHMRWECIVIWINIMALSLTNATYVIILTVNYGRVGLNTNPTAPHTINTGDLSVLSGVLTIVFDIVLLSIPIKPIMGMSFSTRKKIGILLVFLVGALATAASGASLAYRIIFNYRVGKDDTILDWTWVWSIAQLVAGVEVLIITILSCVPAGVSVWRQNIRKKKPEKEHKRWADNVRIVQLNHKKSPADPEMMEDFRMIATHYVRASVTAG